MGGDPVKILNFGSANIDHVYRVPHILKPGETLCASDFQIFCGGKGANQSVALARAGAEVFHGGFLGPDGGLLENALVSAGVHTDYLRRTEIPSGCTVIQVAEDGENSIIYYPGANHSLTEEYIRDTLGDFGPGDMVLCQNEISRVASVLKEGKKRGLTVCFNPSPITPEVNNLPLSCIDIFLVNRLEAEALSGDAVDPGMALLQRFPHSTVVMTLGGEGVRAYRGKETYEVPGFRVRPVDTTGAGDTFTGYFLEAIGRGAALKDALVRGCAGAALSVTNRGAIPSIPPRAEVDDFLRNDKDM